MMRTAAPGAMGPGEDSPSPPLPLPSQLPLSSSHLNVYSGDPQVTASLVGVTSSSCPADLTQKRELTGIVLIPVPWGLPSSLSSPAFFLNASLSHWPPDAESRALAKERQKKDNHNLSESCWPYFRSPELGSQPLPLPHPSPSTSVPRLGSHVLQGCDSPQLLPGFLGKWEGPLEAVVTNFPVNQIAVFRAWGTRTEGGCPRLGAELVS